MTKFRKWQTGSLYITRHVDGYRSIHISVLSNVHKSWTMKVNGWDKTVEYNISFYLFRDKVAYPTNKFITNNIEIVNGMISYNSISKHIKKVNSTIFNKRMSLEDAIKITKNIFKRLKNEVGDIVFYCGHRCDTELGTNNNTELQNIIDKYENDSDNDSFVVDDDVIEYESSSDSNDESDDQQNDDQQDDIQNDDQQDDDRTVDYSYDTKLDDIIIESVEDIEEVETIEKPKRKRLVKMSSNKRTKIYESDDEILFYD